MNHATLLPLVFLCASTGTIAQSTVDTQHTSLTHIRATGTACPVGLEATHGRSLPVSINASPALPPPPRQGPAINGRMVVLPPPPPPAINQQIHLVMTNLVSRDIVSARFTAYGFSNKRRAIYAGAQVPDLTSTVNVTVDVKGNGHASSDLSLKDFTAVASIDLNSITYADGSAWRSSSPGACSVTPNMVMLVAATN
jgi:hypothetical protein